MDKHLDEQFQNTNIQEGLLDVQGEFHSCTLSNLDFPNNHIVYLLLQTFTHTVDVVNRGKFCTKRSSPTNVRAKIQG